MRKGMWSAAALVGLLSGAAVLLIGPAVRAADNVVSMTDDLSFEPKDITVPVGGAVTWHNDSSVQHDAKADDGSFSSPMLDKGKEFSFTFKAPGTFSYKCTVPGHASAGMTGKVIVGAAST